MEIRRTQDHLSIWRHCVCAFANIRKNSCKKDGEHPPRAPRSRNAPNWFWTEGRGLLIFLDYPTASGKTLIQGGLNLVYCSTRMICSRVYLVIASGRHDGAFVTKYAVSKAEYVGAPLIFDPLLLVLKIYSCWARRVGWRSWRLFRWRSWRCLAHWSWRSGKDNSNNWMTPFLTKWIIVVCGHGEQLPHFLSCASAGGLAGLATSIARAFPRPSLRSLFTRGPTGVSQSA